MSRQPIDLADPRLDPTIAACEDGLKRLLHTQHADVLLYAANGHGVWEAVVANLLAPGRSALMPGTGHFSESWAVQTEALGAKVRAHALGRRPADRRGRGASRCCATTSGTRSSPCSACTPTPPAA